SSPWTTRPRRARCRRRRSRTPRTAPRLATSWRAPTARPVRERRGSGAQTGAALQKLEQLARRQRPGEQVTLHLVAAVAAQQLELTARFDPLGDHLEAQALGERDDRLGDRGVVRIGGDVLDERLVDLERLDREALEVQRRRVAGAEVVDREADAETVERLQLGDRLLGVAHDAARGQLALEIGGVESGVLEHARDAAHQVLLLELAPGQ